MFPASELPGRGKKCKAAKRNQVENPEESEKSHGKKLLSRADQNADLIILKEAGEYRMTQFVRKNKEPLQK
jgi:hypothetical protein